MSNKVPLEVAILPNYTGHCIPAYKHEGDSGFDVYFSPHIWEPDYIDLGPLRRTLLPVGLKVAIPHGYEIQMRSRSGWAHNQGIIVLNAPGTIDSPFRGELKVNLWNSNPDESVRIEKGMRIGQAVLCPVAEADFIMVTAGELSETTRGENGWGSTGQ